MTEQTPQEMIDHLDALLDAEREAILAGDLDEMARLLERKTELIDALAAIDLAEAEQMSALQGKLGRNQMLLDGALQGIRRASARLAAMRQVRRTLETYGEDGRKKTIEGQVAHQLEKRA